MIMDITYLGKKYKPARCNEFTYKCDKVNYPSPIETFVFVFKENIDFSCNPYGTDPRHLKEFNLTSLSPIQKDILEKWVKARKYYSAEEDIAYIWNIQGKCSTYFNGIDTELSKKFYKKSLELFDKYSLDAILRQADITPGKNYTYQEIFDPVSKRIDGKTPIIECGLFDKIWDSVILSKIWFYLDKNLNLVDPIDIDNPFQRKNKL